MRNSRPPHAQTVATLPPRLTSMPSKAVTATIHTTTAHRYTTHHYLCCQQTTQSRQLAVCRVDPGTSGGENPPPPALPSDFTAPIGGTPRRARSKTPPRSSTPQRTRFTQGCHPDPRYGSPVPQSRSTTFLPPQQPTQPSPAAFGQPKRPPPPLPQQQSATATPMVAYDTSSNPGPLSMYCSTSHLQPCHSPMARTLPTTAAPSAIPTTTTLSTAHLPR